MMPVAERCLLVEAANMRLSIAIQCGLLSLHRSRFYYEPTPETAENLAILRWLDEQYLEVPFYGVLRLTARLAKAGHTAIVNKHFKA